MNMDTQMKSGVMNTFMAGACAFCAPTAAKYVPAMGFAAMRLSTMTMTACYAAALKVCEVVTKGCFDVMKEQAPSMAKYMPSDAGMKVCAYVAVGACAMAFMQVPLVTVCATSLLCAGCDYLSSCMFMPEGVKRTA